LILGKVRGEISVAHAGGICNASSGRRRRHFELGLKGDTTKKRIVCKPTDKES